MSKSDGPVGTKRRDTAKRVRADVPIGDRLPKQARAVVKDVQQLGGAAREVAQQKLGRWRDGAADGDQQGRGFVRGIAVACRQCVRKRPFNSALIAVGVGVIVAGGSLWLGRNWMRR